MSSESASILKKYIFNITPYNYIKQIRKTSKMSKNDKKWQKMTKNDVSAGRTTKKLTGFPFMGVPKYIKIEKMSKIFEFHALK